MTLIKTKFLDNLLYDKNIEPFDLLEKKFGLINYFRFRNKLYLLSYDVKELMDCDIRKIEYRDCDIIVPQNIDNISYKNMLSINSIDFSRKIGEIASDFVYYVCIESNSDKYSEEGFKKIIQETCYKNIIGIFNKFFEELSQSRKIWKQKFEAVEVTDNDFVQAGGNDLHMFSIIKTIKSICSDFNLKYDDAWNIPYTVVMTNNYDKAYSNYVQDNLRKIKERKMKQKGKR